MKFLSMLLFAGSVSAGQQEPTVINPGKVAEVETSSEPTVRIEFKSELGFIYQLERSFDLKNGWQDVGTAFLGNGKNIIQRVDSDGAKRMFVRVRVAGNPFQKKWVSEYSNRVAANGAVKPEAFKNECPYEIEIYIRIDAAAFQRGSEWVLEVQSPGEGWIEIDATHTSETRESVGRVAHQTTLRGCVPAGSNFRLRESLSPNPGGIRIVHWNEKK